MSATPDKFGIRADPSGKFRAALREASAQCNDLSVPLMLIAKQWFRGNKAIFKLKGPGRYTDLSGQAVHAPSNSRSRKEVKPSNNDYGIGGYKKSKQKKFGFIYPILKASGRLEASITDPKNAEAIASVINKQVLYVGSRVPYAEYLQTGTKKMPSRPYILIGAEQTGPEEFNLRYDAFAETLMDYVRQKLNQRMKA